MTDEEIEKAYEGIEFVPVPHDEPRHGRMTVTHEGVLRLPGLDLKVQQLSTGLRIVAPDEFEKALEWLSRVLPGPPIENGDARHP